MTDNHDFDNFYNNIDPLISCDELVNAKPLNQAN